MDLPPAFLAALDAAPLLLALATALAGTSLIGDLADRQRARYSGARGHVGTDLCALAIFIGALIVAPQFTLLAASRIEAGQALAGAALATIAGGVWLGLLHGLLRCVKRPLAWQAGHLIIGTGRWQQLVAMRDVVQLRLAERGYRIFLRDGSTIPVHLDDPGGRELLLVLLAEKRAPPARTARLLAGKAVRLH